MELKEMSFFEAAEYLDLQIEETVDGLRLTHGSDDDKSGEEVTLEDTKEMISGATESWKMLSKALSDNGATVKNFYVNMISAWTAIENYLKSVKSEES